MAPGVNEVGGFVEEARKTLKGLRDLHRLEVERLRFLDAHYQGVQPLAYMAPELLLELGDRMQQVVIHWPELVVDSVEERLDVEGFRLAEAPEADERLWEWWQANGLDLGSHQAHVDSLVMKRSYIVVGSRGEDDVDPASGVDANVPLITWESPLEMISYRNPRTRRVAAAAKWLDDRPLKGGPEVRRAALYLPDSTSWWVWKDGDWVLDEDGSPGVDEHGMGVVPVVPLINRPRTSTRVSGSEGWSDLEAVIPLSDAACKAATDMMVGAEYHALPRRYATGMTQDDLVDENGRPATAISKVIGRLFVAESENAKMGQFPESDLSNFHDTIKLLAQLVASVSGLPPHYLGSATDNPASADAIRSSEARLVKRAERKQRAFGESWEHVMRIATLVADGRVDKSMRSLETIWRDASTPTVAQAADAAVKKKTAGVVPLRQTREDLGYTAVQIERMEEEDEKEAQRMATAFGGGPDPKMPGDMPQGMPLEPSEGEPAEPGESESEAA